MGFLDSYGPWCGAPSAPGLASTWDFPRQFLNKKATKIKVDFDEISERIK